METKIFDVKEFDKYSKEMQGKITLLLHKSAQMLVEETKRQLLAKYPNANRKNQLYEDTILDGIYYGDVKNGKTKVTVLGNRNKESGTYRTKWFVSGTKERFITGGYRKTKEGIKYVKYKKPMSTGKIEPSDALTKAIDACRGRIIQMQKDIMKEQ